MSTTPSGRAFDVFLKRLETDTDLPEKFRTAIKRDIEQQDGQLGATKEVLSRMVENATI
jgi:hypothetical protein